MELDVPESLRLSVKPELLLHSASCAYTRYGENLSTVSKLDRPSLNRLALRRVQWL
jgi:hypothetical protein